MDSMWLCWVRRGIDNPTKKIETIDWASCLQAHLVLLCFALLLLQILFFFFNKLKVCGNLVPDKSVSIIFLKVFAHFVSF